MIPCLLCQAKYQAKDLKCDCSCRRNDCETLFFSSAYFSVPDGDSLEIEVFESFLQLSLNVPCQSLFRELQKKRQITVLAKDI